MVNYNNGKIYKIESDLGDKIYIGSTTKKYLSQRMDYHRNNYKRWKAGKNGSTTSFKLFSEYGLENCKIVLLETYSCESKDELLSREAYHIKTLNCVNKNIPLRNHKEYYIDNKEQINEQHKQYRLKNKEKTKQRNQQYEKENKENIKERKRLYYIAKKLSKTKTILIENI